MFFESIYKDNTESPKCHNIVHLRYHAFLWPCTSDNTNKTDKNKIGNMHCSPTHPYLWPKCMPNEKQKIEDFIDLTDYFIQN